MNGDQSKGVGSEEPRASVRVRELAGWWQRARGLLGRPAPASGTGVWIHPCRQVHTLGMAYAIDVVYLGSVRTPGVFAVIAVETLQPWRLGRYVFAATGVVELAAGAARHLGLETGGEARLILDPTAC